MNNKLYVIAGNVNEYYHFIKNYHLDIKNCRCITNAGMLRGLRIRYWVCYGSWRDRIDIKEIKYALLYARDINILEFTVENWNDLERTMNNSENYIKTHIINWRHDNIENRLSIENMLYKEEKDVIKVGKNFHNLWENVFDFLQD